MVTTPRHGVSSSGTEALRHAAPDYLGDQFERGKRTEEDHQFSNETTGLVLDDVQSVRLLSTKRGLDGTAQEWISDVENGVVPIYKDHAGFESFSLVDAGDTIVSITHWASQEQAETASEAASSWAKDQSFIEGQTALHVGEEILTSS